MHQPATPSAGPVVPRAATTLSPRASTRVDAGFWAERQRANREVGLPDGYRQLHEAGNVANLVAAATATAPLAPTRGVDPSASGFHAATDGYHGPLFMDSDVYKWLEAVAWERQRADGPGLGERQAELTGLLESAQRPDGYLNSFVQVVTGRPWERLDFSHELYCAGHLIQAAVAADRGAGDPTLLAVAERFADLVTTTFGPGRRADLDGHPIIEMALVELYRHTGERRYLELAAWAVGERGRPDPERSDASRVYLSDRVPVRRAERLEGHAVRALYLASGATDVAIETGDVELLAALERQWSATVATQTYLTGGMGARWEGESFGDPWELPSDRAYAETCAAIASIQWSWRLLLATGRARYADLIERTVYNGMLAGVSLTGDEFFYANALQVRTTATASTDRDPCLGRRRWYSTACCPPNVMRTVAQLGHYVATGDEQGLQIHQHVDATITAPALSVRSRTEYPYRGLVEITVVDATAGESVLSVRVPAWAAGTRVTHPDGVDAAPAGDYIRLRRRWSPGETVRLEMPLEPRVTSPDRRLDSARGCIAVEVGPLVYCAEAVDNPGHDLDDVEVAVTVPEGDSTALAAEGGLAPDRGLVLKPASGPAGSPTVHARLAGGGELALVPYAFWANRGVGPMRVWLPVQRPVPPVQDARGTSAR